MRKNLLLFTLTLLLALPAVAKDFKYEYEGHKLFYTVIDEEAKTVETMHGDSFSSPGNKVSGDLVLPSNPKDGDVEYTLVKISDYAFSNCNELTSVTIPNSVTTIGESAFYGCSGLTSVIIGNSVTTIGNEAFYGCSGLEKSAYPNNIIDPFPGGTRVAYEPEGAIIEDGWIYGPNKTEIRFAPYNIEGEYNIAENVTSIGDNAFRDCDMLTSVKIPNSVTTIGESAFSRSGLKYVIIGNSVTFIGYRAFYFCMDLKKAAYPKTISNPFSSSYSAGSYVSYDPENAIIEEGWIYGPDKAEIIFVPYNLEGEYTIATNVTSIGNNAFANCDGLTSVEIPNSVTTIGTSAFEGCKGMTSVTLPGTIMEIGEKAFADCNNLTEINYNTDDPVEGEKNIFSNEVYSNATLYVKEEALDKVDHCAPWIYFDNVEVKDFPSGVEEIIYNPENGIDPNAPIQIYNLSGQPIASSIANLAPGIYIVRQGKVTKKIAIK